MTQVWAHSRAKGSALLLLLAIADHADDNGRAFPGVESLARKARASETTAHRLLRELVRDGELEIETGTGPRGTNVYHVVGVLAQQPELIGGAISRGGAKMAPVPKQAEGGAKMEGGGATATAPGGATATAPEPSRDVSRIVKEPPRALRAQPPRTRTANEDTGKPPTEQEIKRALHAFAAEAEAVWLAAAEKCNNPYTDRPSKRGVHDQAIAATRWASETQVLHAIAQRMDYESSPRRIPEWARQQAADDDLREHEARLAAERAELSQIVTHDGHTYLGHTPHVAASTSVCGSCGKSSSDHELARPPSTLRSTSGAFAAIEAAAASRVDVAPS